MLINRFKIRIVVLTAIIFCAKVDAALITTDDTWFFSMYDNPTEIIDFTTLKDGTDYASASWEHPLINNTIHHDSGGKYEVWENGWTDNFLIRTSGQIFHAVTRWDGESIGINTSTAPRFSLYALNDVAPISLKVTSDTYSGFVAIIPESPDDRHYEIYYPGIRIQELRAGYSKIPVPATIWLLGSGIIAFLVVRKLAT